MLCLLGPAAVEAGGVHQPLQLRPKEWAVLARVALSDGGVSRADLARQLFLDADDPRRALRWQLRDLRSRLPPQLRDRLDVARDHVRFDGPTDVARFRSGAPRVLSAPRGPGAAAVLALYRGDLCTGLAVSASPEFDTWLYVEQESLRRLFRRSVVAFARGIVGSEAAEAALGPLVRLVAVDPYLEEGHVLLVEVYEALGRRQAARAAYEVYQRLCRTELYAEPRPELVRRYEDAEPAGRPLPRDALVAAGTVTLHVVEWSGGAPTVLGIHGSGGTAYSMTALGERLSPHHRVIAVDLRGHGLSDKPPSGYALGNHVEDIHRLVDELGLRRPVVLGHSLGGAVAAAVAATLDVAGLVLLDAAIGDRSFIEDRHPTDETLELRFTDVDEYLQRWRRDNPRYTDEAERWLERFARYELARLPDGTLRRRNIRQALRGEFTSVLATDTLADLAGVRCPTLLVRAGRPWISREPWLTPSIWRAQAAACPHAHRFVAEGSDHASLVRDPQPDVIGALRRFLAGLASAA